MGEKELIIHLGAHKTGSSALQAFLERSAESLRADAFYYPPSHTHREALSGRTTSGNGIILSFYLEGVDPDHAKTYWQQFLDALDGADQRVVISSERLWGPGFRCLPQLVQEARTRDRKIVFVVYLRPQAEFVPAAYAEAVKRQGFSGNVASYYEANGRDCAYLGKLRQLEEICPEARLVVRPYARDLLADGSLIVDFLKAIGAPVDRVDRDAEPRANRSLTRDELAIFRALNEIGVETTELALLVDRYPMAGVGDKVGLSSALNERILSDFAEENREIAERYFDGNDVLSRSGPIGADASGEVSRDSLVTAALIARLAKALKA